MINHFRDILEFLAGPSVGRYWKIIFACVIAMIIGICYGIYKIITWIIIGIQHS